jgi:cobalamin biosynthesis Mg chelatase CobN
MTTMSSKKYPCPVKDPARKDRAVKWLRLKSVGGYYSWKCLVCNKVSTEDHLGTQKHRNNMAYFERYPLWHEDSEDEKYAELWKQEEEEDERARVEEEKMKRAIAEAAAHAAEEPEPTSSSAAQEMEAAWTAHAAEEPEPTSSSAAAWAEGARAAPAAPKAPPPPLSQASSTSAGAAGSTSSSASAWISGSAPTAEQTALMPMLRLIVENSKKIQGLVKEVNNLAAQNAQLAELVFKEMS